MTITTVNSPTAIVSLFVQAQQAARHAGADYGGTTVFEMDERVEPVIERAWKSFCDSANDMGQLALRQCCMLHAYFRASWLHAAHRAVPTLNLRSVRL